MGRVSNPVEATSDDEPSSGRLAWIWASPPDETLSALFRSLERDDVPQPRVVLKHNANRTVWRVPGAGNAGLIVKRFHGRSGEGFKTWLLGDRAEREFRAMQDFCRAGLPSARPVAWCEVRGQGREPGSWFVSREVEGATTVAQELARHSPDGPAVVALAERLIDLVVELHQHPFWHRDLHAGNILLAGNGRLVIIDLHSMWRVPVLRRRHRLENLARLIFSLRSVMNLDRLPDLAARYARLRDEDEAEVVADISRALDAFERDFVRGKSARCMRNSSEYVGERRSGSRTHRRRSYAADLLTKDLAAHDVLVTSGGQLLSDARASRVSLIEGGGSGRVVKEYLRTGFGPALRARLGFGRARGSWRFARRCRVQGVPTPEALALLERRLGKAWLVTAEVPGAIDVTTWAEALPAGALGTPSRHAVAFALGHLVGRLSRAGLKHPDMSAKNLLLATGEPEPVIDLRLRPPDGLPRVELVDLDNMRRAAPFDEAVMARMLGQLGDTPRVTRTDRLRFARGVFAATGRKLSAEVVTRADTHTRNRRDRREAMEATRRSR